MECKHSQVCKYKRVEPCDLAGVCKFFSLEVPSTAPKKKTGKRGKYKKRGRPGGKQYKLTLSKKDIRAARKLLKEKKSMGLLSDNQIRALDQYKHKRYEELEEVEKRQILDIVKDTNKPKPLLGGDIK